MIPIFALNKLPWYHSSVVKCIIYWIYIMYFREERNKHFSLVNMYIIISNYYTAETKLRKFWMRFRLKLLRLYQVLEPFLLPTSPIMIWFDLIWLFLVVWVGDDDMELFTPLSHDNATSSWHYYVRRNELKKYNQHVASFSATIAPFKHMIARLQA